ncbi:MAG: PilZ domain-containing protein [Proteobacteria bacterium]|nr:PilZ domain-containing protein [Pseudomonadota bacterium]
MSDVSSANQRKYPRKPCPGVMVLYSNGNHFYSDYIYDISENGIFINSNAPIQAGSKISMSFLSFHKRGPIKISGDVIRSLPRGIGVEFKAQNDIQKNALNSFIEGFLS